MHARNGIILCIPCVFQLLSGCVFGVQTTNRFYWFCLLYTIHYTFANFVYLEAVYACIVSKRQVKFTQASTESFLVLAVQISMGRIALQL